MVETSCKLLIISNPLDLLIGRRMLRQADWPDELREHLHKEVPKTYLSAEVCRCVFIVTISSLLRM